MTKRHQQTLTIVARDRFEIHKCLKKGKQQFRIYDKMTKLHVDYFDIYSEARVECNALNNEHLSALQWALDDHIVTVQLELF